jgi:hypothetical protein
MRIELRVLKIMLPVELVPVAQLTGSHSSQHGAPVGSTELARQIQDKLQLAGKGFSAVTGSALAGLSYTLHVLIGTFLIFNRNEHAG